MEIVIITGFSGAGKSQVLDLMEDMGYYSMDNLPPALLPKFAELAMASPDVEKAAVVVDLRSGSFFSDLFGAMDELRNLHVSVKILFLEAEESVIVSRYKELRRPHPLGDSIVSGYREEAELLGEIRSRANLIIDTSGTKTADLREEIQLFFGKEGSGDIILSIVSFGFKHGILKDGDLVFDVRFLPNPYYIPELKNTTGLEEKTAQYVINHEQTRVFLQKTEELLDFLLPHYEREGKRVLVMGIGCTGGCHRSVAITEALGEGMRARGYTVKTRHRDLPGDRRG